jgi:hypothetical protein
MKAATVKVKRQCNIRYYEYVAHLSAKTGRLLRITAGCRVWKTFDAALRHYDGLRGHPKWLDSRVTELERGYRTEAIHLLRRLRGTTEYKRFLIRARLRGKKRRKA